eukprot:9634949-Lingulodinium_polyedra.AAC.1
MSTSYLLDPDGELADGQAADVLSLDDTQPWLLDGHAPVMLALDTTAGCTLSALAVGPLPGPQQALLVLVPYLDSVEGLETPAAGRGPFLLATDVGA